MILWFPTSPASTRALHSPLVNNSRNPSPNRLSEPSIDLWRLETKLEQLAHRPFVLGVIEKLVDDYLLEQQ